MMPGTGKFKIKRKEKNFLGDKKKKNKTELCFDPFDHIIASDLHGTHQENNDCIKTKTTEALDVFFHTGIAPTQCQVLSLELLSVKNIMIFVSTCFIIIFQT